MLLVFLLLSLKGYLTCSLGHHCKELDPGRDLLDHRRTLCRYNVAEVTAVETLGLLPCKDALTFNAALDVFVLNDEGSPLQSWV